MKYAFFLACLGLSLIFSESCKKSGNDNARLTGRWEMRKMAAGGGMAPHSDSAYAADTRPGNGNVWAFSDSSFRSYFRGRPSDSGSYRITEDTISPTQQKMDKLTLIRPSGNFELFFQFSGNTLIIYDGILAADGTIRTYARIDDTFNPGGPSSLN